MTTCREEVQTWKMFLNANTNRAENDSLLQLSFLLLCTFFFLFKCLIYFLQLTDNELKMTPQKGQLATNWRQLERGGFTAGDRYKDVLKDEADLLKRCIKDDFLKQLYLILERIIMALLLCTYIEHFVIRSQRILWDEFSIIFSFARMEQEESWGKALTKSTTCFPI